MDRLITGTEQEAQVRQFIKEVQAEDEFARAAEDTEKKGMEIGAYAINPVNGDRVPILVANYVLMGYGTGAVMGVPAHDDRDFAFAKKYGLEIRPVIKPVDGQLPEPMTESYIEDGVLINSGDFTGMENKQAMVEITKYLESKGQGCFKVNYRLRDWLISRQRYWGTPIPIVYCDQCGIVPVPEDQLPVMLPEDVELVAGRSRYPPVRMSIPPVPSVRSSSARNRYHGYLYRFLLVLPAVL